MTKSRELDDEFIAGQRKQLQELRAELLRIQRGMDADERDRSDEQRDTQLDEGDMSLHMYTREMDATIGGQAERRLEEIERALQKIEEGTYGLCDDTGEAIPKGRLEAVPEAIRTVEAQQTFERGRRPAT